MEQALNYVPDYTVAYILLFLSVVCFIIFIQLWKRRKEIKNGS